MNAYTIKKKNPDENSSMKIQHYHDYYEIYFYLGNEMTFYIKNQPVSVKKYDLVLVDRFINHRTSYNKNDSSERINIDFTPGDLKPIGDPNTTGRILSLFSGVKYSFPDQKHQLQLYEIILRLCRHSGKTSGSIDLLMSRLILNELLLMLLHLSDCGAAVGEKDFFKTSEIRIAQILDYINCNFRENITLQSISADFFINKYYLCHIFKKVTEMSVASFINHKRLMEAEILLKYSSHTITRVCELSGFNNITHFYSLFKKVYGCTPHSFRCLSEKSPFKKT